MQDFQFHRPATLEEALASLEKAEEGKLLAGGQSLIPLLKLDLAMPTDLVSLADVPGLGEIRRDGDSLVIGATATHTEVETSDVVRSAIPALADLAGHIGDPQVRNRGTIGGSLAHTDPAADYPAAILALGATIVTHRRRIPADDYFRGLFETALEEHEIVTAVELPIPERAAYMKFPNPASKYAIVGVFVAKTKSEVRLAVTGAGESPFRVAEAEGALAKSFKPEALDKLTVSSEGLVDDLQASAEYRAHLIAVMARRAVAAAAQ